MFIICEVDFPKYVCPVGTDEELAEKIAKHYQDELQKERSGLAIRYFHVVKVEYVPAELVVQLKLEMEANNGS